MLQYPTPNDYFDLRASKAIATEFSAGGPMRSYEVGAPRLKPSQPAR